MKAFVHSYLGFVLLFLTLHVDSECSLKRTDLQAIVIPLDCFTHSFTTCACLW